MRISPIGSIDALNSIGSIDRTASAGSTGGAAGISFGDAISKAIGQVNDLQKQADDMAVKMATGDVEDVHKAMLAMNKAKLAFDFTMQVRNKVVEAYQEIMRMQV